MIFFQLNGTTFGKLKPRQGRKENVIKLKNIYILDWLLTYRPNTANNEANALDFISSFSECFAKK